MIAPSETVLETIRRRRFAGESLGSLARECGLSWQKLWGYLHNAPPRAGQSVVRPAAGSASLVEKYRPTSLDTLWGQEAVVNALRAFAANPYPAAFLFEGDTGTGKTSAALALAAELGCDLSQKEFGGVQTIASGEQSADAVRDAYRQMFNCPWHGSGWKVVIVNEADRMARPAETIWLDVLEAIPARTVIIFTTNEAERLSQRFRDRCTRLTFESQATKLKLDAYGLLAGIWRQETGTDPDMAAVAQIVEQATEHGRLSFRRAVQALTAALVLEGGR